MKSSVDGFWHITEQEYSVAKAIRFNLARHETYVKENFGNMSDLGKFGQYSFGVGCK